MEQSIIQEAERYVEHLFQQYTGNDLFYHDLSHTLRVRDAAILLGNEQNLSESELEILTLSSIFHDTGYLEGYENHEKKSVAVTRRFLTGKNYADGNIDTIANCILATTIGVEPITILEKILKDADLSNLGSINFFEVSKNLRKEWNLTKGKSYTDEEWYDESLGFFKQHSYYSEVAKNNYNKTKKANQKRMKKLLKKERSKKDPGASITLNESKSAQMMFKTALRNHIDLTNIADNKANIMLTINTIVISIIMSLFASNIEANRHLIIPVSILLTTCVASIIFATLATRPIKMNGHTSMERVKEGKANLFFFGNFYKMTLPQYREGLHTIINDDKLMDDSIMRDLYFLGKALGNKYNVLRTCYLVFMVGITISVIAFAITFLAVPR